MTEVLCLAQGPVLEIRSAGQLTIQALGLMKLVISRAIHSSSSREVDWRWRTSPGRFFNGPGLEEARIISAYLPKKVFFPNVRRSPTDRESPQTVGRQVQQHRHVQAPDLCKEKPTGRVRCEKKVKV